jgi:transposase
MKKRTYKAIKVQNLVFEKLVEQIGEQRCVIGIDVAKEDLYAGIGGPEGQTYCIVKWKHPFETVSFLELVSGLQAAGRKLEAAMEPSGTYSDALKYQLQRLGVAVYRVDPKRCHDMAMVLDGVDSQHDPKSASLLIYLHARGISELWAQESEQRRQMKAQVIKRELYFDPLERHYGRLEGKLAAHWPELPYLLDMRGGSILELLSQYGSAQEVANSSQEAAKLLRRSSRGGFSTEKIDEVIRSANNTLGAPVNSAEREVIKALTAEMKRLRSEVMQCDKVLKGFAKDCESTKYISATVGLITSVVLMSLVGEPSEYDCARSYEKALGLNLKERSSGKHKGKLRITKRGNATARKYLYLAALRLISKDAVIRAWYDKRARPGEKRKAVVAVMRKLAKAIWYVSQGSCFDVSKLFDVRRLELGKDAAQAV